MSLYNHSARPIAMPSPNMWDALYAITISAEALVQCLGGTRAGARM
jgi:hypothetical protein